MRVAGAVRKQRRLAGWHTVPLALLIATGLAVLGLFQPNPAFGEVKQPAPSYHTAAPLAESPEASLQQAPCEHYATFYRFGNIGNPIYLRVGDFTFGYNHIVQRHGYNQTAIRYTLVYGNTTEVQGTKYVVEVNYGGDRWRVVYNTTHNSAKCPGRQLGVITAYQVG